MLQRTICLAILAATAAMTATLPANAGCCCAIACPAPAPVMVYQPYEMPQIYIVDRGPVYSGPGIYTNPTVMVPRPMPAYPYVGSEYPGYLPPYSEPLRSRAHAVLPRRPFKRAQAR